MPAPSIHTAERLAHYASQFPIVEVDATYYALPSERNAHLWVDRTPSGFVFNIKAFGLFTHHPVVLERLPAAAKELLPAAMAGKSRVFRLNHGFSVFGSAGPVVHDLLTALSDSRPFAVWAATPDVRRLRT
jgi:uncharacterized protein YecE (DUF72 family)